MGRPMYANNAALAVLRLSEHTGSGDILALAVQMSRTAAAITPDDHPDRVSHLANLGAALARAAIRSRDAIVLDEAIEVLESAIRIASPDHPAYGGLTLSLGETLLIRGRAQSDDGTVARGQNLIRQSAAWHTCIPRPPSAPPADRETRPPRQATGKRQPPHCATRWNVSLKCPDTG